MKLSQIDKNKIIADYQSGLSFTAIGASYRRDPRTIKQVLAEAGIGVRKAAYRVLHEERLGIISMYNSGKTSVEIAKRYGISSQLVVSRLKDWKISLRSRHDVSYYKWQVNHAFFDEVDSEAKAYFLGFLYADGYNTGGNGCYNVKLALHEKDVSILEKFSAMIKSNRPLIYSEQKRQYTLRLSSKLLSERLTELGCHRAKSFTLTFPVWLSKSLLRHFVRGYMDGDGWIAKRERWYTAGAIGSTAFIEKMSEIISRECGVDSPIKAYKTKGISTFEISGKIRVSEFLRWLYKGATIYLDRKQETANLILLK